MLQKYLGYNICLRIPDFTLLRLENILATRAFQVRLYCVTTVLIAS